MTIAQTFSKQRIEASENGEVGPSLTEFGSRYLAVRVPQDREEDIEVAMILFEDLSGFFGNLTSEKDTPGIEPWPEEFGPHFQQEIFQIDASLVPDDLVEMMSCDFTLITENKHLAITAIFESAARLVPDAPEGLLGYILTTEKDWTWEDPDTSDAALTLLAQLSWLLAGGHATIYLHAAAAPGQSPAQKRQETWLYQLSKAHNLPTYPGQRPNYEGKAYATFADEQDPAAPECLHSYASAYALSVLLSEVSATILEEYGRPEGWQTTYNDGIGERSSGYSADSAVEQHDTGFLSAHEIIEAHTSVADFIRERGLKPRILEIIEQTQLTDHSFAEFVRGLD